MARVTEINGEKISYRLKAVIDVGSTSIRMAVAQIHDDGSYRTLDSLNQSVAIGSDTFTHGSISGNTRFTASTITWARKPFRTS